MKFIISKKNNPESITLDLESTATIDDLFLILYDSRSRNYAHLSFKEYQNFISVYYNLLYGDRFINKLLPGTNLSDYQLEEPCYLTWEEFAEEQCSLAHVEFNPMSGRFFLWQGNMEQNESASTEASDDMKPGIP
ncbi:hypothetical protein EP47_08250 [Legionella norrlandica]|uniref:Uncharacterized protein n=1 Tax=Legionella norrlandica TaxID=1498499 RepID=A0A0A2STN2_9GAMM|nr:hypothetical protein [Legionella norrlandica]KGP64122.1 hypothetical protein EP47_08250 [Legionella norrlandica]